MDRIKYMFVKTKLILSISLGLSTSFSVADQGIDLLGHRFGVSFASESRAVQSKHKNPSSVTTIDAADQRPWGDKYRRTNEISPRNVRVTSNRLGLQDKHAWN